MNSKLRFEPPEKAYDGYIFDCDGTLADTMPLHFEAWRFALGEVGATFEFGWDLFVSRAGMSLELTVQELSAQFALPLDPKSIAKSQYEFYRAREKSIGPIAEVVNFAKIVRNHAKIAVASGSLRASVQHTLATIGASDLFEIIVTPEDVHQGKPAPDMFLLAAKKMGIEPSRCLVLEDAEFGFEAARRAGMDFAVVQARRPL